mmetsp:Transcript_1145/g.4783  ORF Transcript_1145/g.4783 Transcript_1145/m.4783 type:complete len:214 (-) Transcript_1145:676-1317(-)
MTASFSAFTASMMDFCDSAFRKSSIWASLASMSPLSSRTLDLNDVMDSRARFLSTLLLDTPDSLSNVRNRAFNSSISPAASAKPSFSADFKSSIILCSSSFSALSAFCALRPWRLNSSHSRSSESIVSLVVFSFFRSASRSCVALNTSSDFWATILSSFSATASAMDTFFAIASSSFLMKTTSSMRPLLDAFASSRACASLACLAASARDSRS